MKNFTQMLSDLNLVYYEYDRHLRTFMADPQYIKESSMELITIAQLLCVHQVPYTIDERRNIHITQKFNR